MLVLEPKQFQAFAMASFVERMTDVIAALPADAVASRRELAQEIAEQVSIAQKFGFREEQDCARWIVCAWCLGADFYKKMTPLSTLLQRDDVGTAYKALSLEVTLRAVFMALAGQSRALP